MLLKKIDIYNVMNKCFKEKCQKYKKKLKSVAIFINIILIYKQLVKNIVSLGKILKYML